METKHKCSRGHKFSSNNPIKISYDRYVIVPIILALLSFYNVYLGNYWTGGIFVVLSMLYKTE